ncbi:DUF1795 domain-containing protein [Cronobacter malonaticus]|nr:DUF1795 domain-containing protein [Cronobacter universalis]
MSALSSVSLFNEGSISLPEGYQDRTVNVFVQPAAGAPSFNISRDALQPREILSAYIDRQLLLMQQHMKGWSHELRDSAVLGDNLLHGEIVHASYLRDGKRIWQQQAVFNIQDAHILVITMSSPTKLTERDNLLFMELLRSFRFHD